MGCIASGWGITNGEPQVLQNEESFCRIFAPHFGQKLLSLFGIFSGNFVPHLVQNID
jgi:hypothetical protein